MGRGEEIMRTFESGATRDDSQEKIDFHGFLSPIVLQAYGEYMLKHQAQADGELRSSDNWKKGIPREECLKSLLRHTHDLWMIHDGYEGRDTIDDALCGVMFNTMAYYHYLLEERGYASKHELPPINPNTVKITDALQQAKEDYERRRGDSLH